MELSYDKADFIRCMGGRLQGQVEVGHKYITYTTR